MKRAIALVTESTRRDGTRQGFAAPRPVGAPLTEPAPPPKKDRLRGRCPSESSPGSRAPNPDSSHSNWTILWGQVTFTVIEQRPPVVAVLDLSAGMFNQGSSQLQAFARRQPRDRNAPRHDSEPAMRGRGGHEKKLSLRLTGHAQEMRQFVPLDLGPF